MRAIRRTSAVVVAALQLAACGSASPTSPPAATAGEPGVASAAAGPCSEPAIGTATDVEATVSGNTWGPVSALSGQVITWTNADAVPHQVALDDGTCTMTNTITGSAPQSLAFGPVGSYPFHCTIHPSMKGTITIS